MSSSAVPPAGPGGPGSPVNINIHTYPAVLQYPPRTYLVFAVIVTVLFFWPTGIAAVVNALRVVPLWKAQQLDGAQKASRRAFRWSMVTLVVGAVAHAVFWTAISQFSG